MGKPWSITTAESHFTAFLEDLVFPQHVAGNLYFQKYTPELNWRVFLVFGIIIGGSLGALIGGDFKIRIPPKKKRFVQVFIGGVLMGFGARLALGCNIGHIMSGVPQLALSSALAFGGILLGAFIGTKILMRLI
jgi:hypothetical protein